MNPNACRVVLRRRGPLEVFDLSLRFVQAHPAVFARLVAVTVGPLLPLAALACWLLDGHPALVLIPLALAPALQAPATVLAGRLLFADRIRVRDVLRELLSHPRRLAIVTAAWWVPFLLGCGALAWVPQIRWCWVTEVALLEQPVSGGEGQRSARLTRLHPGVATSAVFGWYALTAWGGVAGEAVGQSVTGTILQLGNPFGVATDLRATPFLLAGLLLAQPLFGVVRLLLYLDVRTRAEGWDLQVALRALGLANRRTNP